MANEGGRVDKRELQIETSNTNRSVMEMMPLRIMILVGRLQRQH